jgi:hypothetical protein
MKTMWPGVFVLLLAASPASAVAADACPEVEAALRMLTAIEAPRDQREFQVSGKREGIQAFPRQEEIQAPRGQEEDIQAPRDAALIAAQVAGARALITEAQTACARGDRAEARQKASAAMTLMREAR